ncbi:FkbM family methyltransferase [Pendulispora albinea]|uniref:FkbM family methyltransferase n=1 Tax=Pendulispora albinea TaxID=2741071 RepID=A0ABZ2LRX4_9BACT
MEQTVNLRAELLRRFCSSLPVRRYQAYHWLGKLFEPKAPYIVNFTGGRFEVRPGDLASIMVAYCGFYERETTVWFRRYCENASGAFIDVGAEFGYFPMLADRYSNRRLRTFAFEPDPRNHAWLLRNIALNPGINVDPIAEAVCDARGTVKFEKPREGFTIFSRIQFVPGEAGGPAKDLGSELIDVPSTTLDIFRRERGLSKISLVKIDVEGAEGAVLQGMQEGIAEGAYERILLELHPWAFDTPERMEKILGILNGLLVHYEVHQLPPFDTGGRWVDKTPDYYRMTWKDEFLRAVPRFEEQHVRGERNWEHFVFVRKGVSMFPAS